MPLGQEEASRDGQPSVGGNRGRRGDWRSGRLSVLHRSPAMARVNAILEDVKGVTTKVKEETERVDHAIRTTMDRVDDTADRVRSNVRAKTSRVVGFIRGLRVAIESMLHAGPHHQPHERQT